MATESSPLPGDVQVDKLALEVLHGWLVWCGWLVQGEQEEETGRGRKRKKAMAHSHAPSTHFALWLFVRTLCSAPCAKPTLTTTNTTICENLPYFIFRREIAPAPAILPNTQRDQKSGTPEEQSQQTQHDRQSKRAGICGRQRAFFFVLF